MANKEQQSDKSKGKQGSSLSIKEKRKLKKEKQLANKKNAFSHIDSL